MTKFDIEFEPPLLNSAGTLGFTPDTRWSDDLSELGGFITNPISKQPRSPANGTRFIEYPGGFLLHTGYPNPGFRAVLRRYQSRWVRSPIPVIVHLLLEDIYQTQQMIMALENTAGVSGIEIGMPPDLDAALVEQVSEVISSELPLILRLPYEKAVQLSDTAGQAFLTSFIALSVAPPRGMLIDANGNSVEGRLYGPALYTQTLALTSRLVSSGIPIIIGGGIYYRSQVEELLEMGAIAVQLDAILWRGGMLSGRASGPE